ncbi:YciI family protein [Catellatospora sp. NPDC049609]|uniref:YciI family protein n=1 Tax=Catellatospora sp. NPDC049609 TaxID=3155505 RepID=UPI00341A678C
MKQYLLSIYQPDGGPPPPEVLDPVLRALAELNAELDAAGALVRTDALLPPETATVVRVRDGEVLLTDGPYAEGKEHVGGFWIIRALDLDAALFWAGKAARATTLPIEVRPLHTGDG